MPAGNGRRPIISGQRESGFLWELYIPHSVRQSELNPTEICFFVNKVRAAPYNKVSPFLKQEITAELLDHYKLLREDGLATNLGSPWLGTSYQRTRIASC
jgi:hypothetical protein